MSRWLHAIVLRSTLKPPIFSSFCRSFNKSAYLYSYYDTLKVNPSATLKEIKDAYLKLTKQYHPDLHPNDPKCHDRFIQLQEAYKILSNPDTRREYDRKTRNKPSPKYQRPYAYPDYTQRDEWLKQEEMRRETHFKQDFSRENFNQYYSKPHKLSPEELERFYKYQKFAKTDKFLYYVFGMVLVGVVIEALVMAHQGNELMWKNFFRGQSYRIPEGSELYGITREEDLRRWSRNMDDETFRVLTRRREDSGRAYPHNYNKRDITSAGSEF